MSMNVPPGGQRTRAARGIAAEMGIDAHELQSRREFLELGAEDDEMLRSLNALAVEYADPVIEEFYKHLLSFEVGRQFFRDRAVLERVKAAQKRYFLGLTRGDYGPTYVEDRLTIGAVHERIGLPVAAYLGMYSFYLRAVATRLFGAFEHEPARVIRALQALLKLVFLDIGLAIDTYVFQRERTIRVQQEAIRELSTPVLQVRPGLLILPIVGVIDSVRARQLTEQLLRAIRAQRARVVVIDVTGVPAIDSKVANHLVQTVEATRLMGARVILTGMSPEIAQTLVVLGVDLAKMRTVGDLQGGLEEAERMLGYVVTKPGESRLEPGPDDDDR